MRPTASRIPFNRKGSCKCSGQGFKNECAFSGVSCPRAINNAATRGFTRSCPAGRCTAAESCFLIVQRFCTGSYFVHFVSSLRVLCVYPGPSQHKEHKGKTQSSR